MQISFKDHNRANKFSLKDNPKANKCKSLTYLGEVQINLACLDKLNKRNSLMKKRLILYFNKNLFNLKWVLIKNKNRKVQVWFSDLLNLVSILINKNRAKSHKYFKKAYLVVLISNKELKCQRNRRHLIKLKIK